MSYTLPKVLLSKPSHLDNTQQWGGEKNGDNLCCAAAGSSLNPCLFLGSCPMETALKGSGRQLAFHWALSNHFKPLNKDSLWWSCDTHARIITSSSFQLSCIPPGELLAFYSLRNDDSHLRWTKIELLDTNTLPLKRTPAARQALSRVIFPISPTDRLCVQRMETTKNTASSPESEGSDSLCLSLLSPNGSSLSRGWGIVSVGRCHDVDRWSVWLWHDFFVDTLNFKLKYQF